jgi:transposase-like protein
MSRDAVDLSLAEIYAMDDRACREFLVRARWGSKETIRCPHCGTIAPHYWRPQDKRWKCCACDKTFGITAGTVFGYRKLELRELLAGAMLWINSSAGQPALELKRHFNKTYNTAFTLQHKLREALIRGYNVGLLSGDIEMDGSYQAGRNAAGRRGKPQANLVSDDKPADKINTASLTQADKQRERAQQKLDGVVDEYGKRHHRDQRQIISIRKRSGRRGRGAAGSRVAVAIAEYAKDVKPIIADFVANAESFLNTDTAGAYVKVGRDKFIEHRSVIHSKELVGPNGENNNLAEELNFRLDRAEQGVYLNLEAKYLLDYAVEIAFRADTRRLPNGSQLLITMHLALNVGSSQYWIGFTHGRHRSVELTHPKPRRIAASGPKKGRNPRQRADNRPPR